MKKTYFRLLSIAGSDSGGGAGIQADLKTFSARDCYGMSVITALTAQNTIGVQAIFPVPAEFVAAQLKSVLDDIGVDAIKIGMLHNADIISVVTDNIRKLDCPIVVDPVMFAKSGHALLSRNAIEIFKKTLLPLATVITPNLPEAEYLSGIKIDSIKSIKRAAIKISEYGAKSVLIKGGHTDSVKCVDFLYHNNCFQKFSAQRILSNNTHGTGCTLSAAIAAELAKGNDLNKAIRTAKRFITKAIARGAEYTLGKGYGPVKWE